MVGIAHKKEKKSTAKWGKLWDVLKLTVRLDHMRTYVKEQ